MRNLVMLPTKHLLVFFLVALAFTAGCSKQTSQNDSNGSKPQNAVAAPIPPILIEPKLGVGKVRKGMNEQEVEAVLGKPDSKQDGIWRYKTQGVWVLFRQNEMMFNVHCYRPFQGVTKEGIGIGSSRDEVIKAFGTPSETKHLDHGIENYNQDGESLWFAPLMISCVLESNKITRIVVHLDVR